MTLKFLAAVALAGCAWAEASALVETDTIADNVVTLDEVSVSAPRIIQRTDGIVAIPTEAITKSSTTGVDLLNRMHLPRLSVNQMTNTVSLVDGSSTELRLNGVRITASELAALPPSSITRIEYFDHPVAKYGNEADAVINIITRRSDIGAGVFATTFTGWGDHKFASFGAISANVVSGKSDWRWTSNYIEQSKSDWYRDYQEVRYMPDQTVKRREVGDAVKAVMHNWENSLNYRYDLSDNTLINAKLGLDLNRQPYSELGDRSTTLYSSELATPISVNEHLSDRSTTTYLDLYASHQLPSGGKLNLDVRGTIISSRSLHEYSELPSVYYSSLIHGNRKSLISEASYSQPFGRHNFSSGLHYAHAYTRNRYAGDVLETVGIRQNEAFVYAEDQMFIGNVSIKGGVNLSLIDYRQEGINISHWSVNPSFFAKWNLSAASSINYSIMLSAKTPQLAMMSDVSQRIDPTLVTVGNPSVKPYQSLDQSLNMNYNHSWWSANVHLGYLLEFKPVMEEYIASAGLITKTYANQRSFAQWSIEPSLSLHPWGEKVNLSVSPLWHLYRSKGNSYACHYNLFRLKVDAEATFGNWLMSYATMMGPENYMYGCTLYQEKNMRMIQAGYRWPSVTLQLGCFNPFMKQYWMTTKVYSDVFPSYSKAYSGHNEYFIVNLTVNLHRGKQKWGKQQEINNSDTDAGLLKGTR